LLKRRGRESDEIHDVSSAIIFDLDGVVADTHLLHARAWELLLKEESRKIDKEDLSVIREGRKREEILHRFFGELSREEAARLGARKEELFRRVSGDLKPTEGLVEFLDELEKSDIPKTVATSASRRRTEDILNQLSLAGRFVGVVTGDDVERGKPDPHVFLLAAKHFDLKVTDVLVIEDSPAGVRAAKAAGMKCVGLGTNGWARQLYEAGADYVIPKFSQASWQSVRDVLEGRTPKPISDHGA
jgi:beta-phosphoglucomutase